MSSTCFDHSPIVNVVTEWDNEIWEYVEVNTLVDQPDHKVHDVDELHELNMEPGITVDWLSESELTSSLFKGEDLVSLFIFLPVDWDRFRNLHISDGLAVQVVHRRDALKGYIVHH